MKSSSDPGRRQLRKNYCSSTTGSCITGAGASSTTAGASTTGGGGGGAGCTGGWLAHALSANIENEIASGFIFMLKSFRRRLTQFSKASDRQSIKKKIYLHCALIYKFYTLKQRKNLFL